MSNESSDPTHANKNDIQDHRALNRPSHTPAPPVDEDTGTNASTHAASCIPTHLALRICCCNDGAPRVQLAHQTCFGHAHGLLLHGLTTNHNTTTHNQARYCCGWVILRLRRALQWSTPDMHRLHCHRHVIIAVAVVISIIKCNNSRCRCSSWRTARPTNVVYSPRGSCRGHAGGWLRTRQCSRGLDQPGAATGAKPHGAIHGQTNKIKAPTQVYLATSLAVGSSNQTRVKSSPPANLFFELHAKRKRTK